MAKTEQEKPARLQKRHEERQTKRERTGDTPEAVAERRKSAKQYDEDYLRKLGERTGVYQ